MIKQKIKSYLRRKLKNLLNEDFVSKYEFNLNLDNKLNEKSEEFNGILENKLNEKNNEINGFLENKLNEKNDEINGISKSIEDLSRSRNQYGEWIHQLFTYVGSLYMFSDDINEKLNEVFTAAEINASYLSHKIKQNKKVVYTCLTGNYDVLPLHSYLDFDWDYICFTDSEELLKAKMFGAWEIRPLVFDKLDNVRNNRWHKTHPHKILSDYQYSIYIDSNISIKSSWIFDLIDKRKETNRILIPIHYERDSIFDDIEFVVNVLRKETRENANKMIEFLNKENFPKDYGLNENCLIFRQHNDKDIINLMEDWWYFIKNYTKRDQFSFPYVLWKHGLKPKDISIPNIRPLVNSFRIDTVHRQKSVFSEPVEFNFSDYTKTDRKFEYTVETTEQYHLYYRRAGWIALDEDFDVYLKANKQFYKSNKVMREDVKNNFKFSKSDVGFDVKISFYDPGEGELSLYIVCHSKKEIYIKEIQ